jgi:hypothetical protein
MTEERRMSLGWRLLSNLTRRPFSRLVLVVTMWMTWRVTAWAFDFANATAGVGGYDVAATLAAITAPFAALQAAAFKVYTEGKTTE